MVELQKDIERIKAAGIQLVAISYDAPEVLKKFAEDNRITYPLLSDPGSKTIDAYGIRNTQMNGVKLGGNDLTGIPHPGTYIIDKERIVRAKLFLKRYTERHATHELLEAAKTVK